MKNKTVVEIIGISGSGKSTYLRKLKENCEAKSFFTKRKNIKRKIRFILKNIINFPRDFFLLAIIFDYFLDDVHKESVIKYLNRFIKIYKILVLSRLNRVKINNFIIQESIVHLSINLNKKSSTKFIKILKKLYRVDRIFFIYLDIDAETAIQRMNDRGDNLNICLESLKKRYFLASDFYRLLLNDVEDLENKKNSNLTLNSKYPIDTNLYLLNSWICSKDLKA